MNMQIWRRALEANMCSQREPYFLMAIYSAKLVVNIMRQLVCFVNKCAVKFTFYWVLWYLGWWGPGGPRSKSPKGGKTAELSCTEPHKEYPTPGVRKMLFYVHSWAHSSRLNGWRKWATVGIFSPPCTYKGPEHTYGGPPAMNARSTGFRSKGQPPVRIRCGLRFRFSQWEKQRCWPEPPTFSASDQWVYFVGSILWELHLLNLGTSTAVHPHINK